MNGLLYTHSLRFSIVNDEYQKVPNVPEDNWVWQPTGLSSNSEVLCDCLHTRLGVINIHLPERWGIVQFSTDPINVTQVMESNFYLDVEIMDDLYF